MPIFDIATARVHRAELVSDEGRQKLPEVISVETQPAIGRRSLASQI